jgi:cadherin EGF LAG seven-pass G-type receptor 1
MVELDYESSHKKYDLVVRAASPPLRTDAHVEILVTDVNDNAPLLCDFQVTQLLKCIQLVLGAGVDQSVQ